MTNFSRRGLRQRHAFAVLMASAALIGLAPAAHAQSSDPVASDDSAAADSDEIVVIGSGETRSVVTLLPANLDTLPPGTSVQKALNFLPGVMAQSIDALGVNEQSLSLQVRGFNTTHLGYTLDGAPLGDGAYNNYNGLTISRALISENLGRADLATGIAGLSIPSTSNLGGALMYTSSDPKKEMSFTFNETVGSANSFRAFARFDTGEHGGFSAYISGHYVEQDLFVKQAADNWSNGKQINAKMMYRGDGFTLTLFGDLSRTNQADDAYLSKEILGRRGWDLGGYAPNWGAYLQRADCQTNVPSITCVDSVLPEKRADVTYTNGQILRNDDFFYLKGEFDITKSLRAKLQGYIHKDKGAGNNWIFGLSNQGTASTADDVPVQIRDTRYTINRRGILGSLAWDLGFNRLEAGLWYETNTSSAARYIWTNVTAPFSLAQFLKGQPDTAQWVQETEWRTRQFYVEDTVKLLDDRLSIDFGFKGTYSRSAAHALPGIAKAPAAAGTQFATGTLIAEDNFLPEAGVRYEIAPGHEVFASYAENVAMYQGGFKLGPQSVSQAIWNVQGATLKPETSRSFEGGYRYVSRWLQVSLSAYKVNFDNRLLQYNPCATNQQQNPGCNNSFHNVGGVTSKGAELGVLWKPTPWLSWYNSASLNESTYDSDLAWSLGATSTILPTAGKQQVDTPKQMFASVLSVNTNGFYASLQGKHTGRRYYTFTNDQSFAPVTTFDLGFGYDFGENGWLKGAKVSFNVTNLTNKRYASNFDSSVFAPSDSGVIANGDTNAVAGDVLVFHASAPRQAFGTVSFAF